jgi:pyrimidine oxygenase
VSGQAATSVRTVLAMLIADDDEDKAWERWRSYQAGVDLEALAWATGQASLDKNVTDSNATTGRMTSANAQASVNMGIGTLIGSYQQVAEMLDEMAQVPGTRGIMLVLDDFVPALEAFAEHIQPKLACRTS